MVSGWLCLILGDMHDRLIVQSNGATEWMRPCPYGIRLIHRMEGWLCRYLSGFRGEGRDPRVGQICPVLELRVLILGAIDWA
jgi:hypothetical protein